MTAEGHLALGQLELHTDWGFSGAEASFAQAVSLEPSLAEAHRASATLLAMLRRFDEAIAALETARALDPVSFALHSDGGMIYFTARRYEQAIAMCSKALALQPKHLGPRQCLLDAYL